MLVTVWVTFFIVLLLYSETAQVGFRPRFMLAVSDWIVADLPFIVQNLACLCSQHCALQMYVWRWQSVCPNADVCVLAQGMVVFQGFLSNFWMAITVSQTHNLAPKP